jgi:hypothetical protein
MGDDDRLVTNEVSEFLNIIIFMMLLGVHLVLLLDEFFHLVIPVEGAYI